MSLVSLVLLGACGPDFEISVDSADESFDCTGDSEEALAEGFARDLEPEGCRYSVTAGDPDGNVQLLLDVPAFADAAAGESVSVTYTLPDDAVRLSVQVGCGLGRGWCDEDGGTDGFVMRTYEPTSGTVAIDGTPDGEDSVALVVFDAVTLVDEYEESVLLDTSWEVRLYRLE